MGKWHPTDIISYMYATPFADGFGDFYLCALVYGE